MTTSPPASPSPTSRKFIFIGIGALILTLLTLLSLTQCSTLHPSEKVFDSRAFIGKTSFEGPKLTAEWSAWFKVSPETVKNLLIDWEKNPEIMENVDTFEIKERSDNTSTFYLELKSPAIIIPNPKMTLTSTFEELPDGSMRVSWVMQDGSPKNFLKSWTFRKEGDGTRVEHNFLFEFPFSPPNFAKPDPGKKLEGDIERFRAYLGVKESFAVAR